ncbi:hypothetical protein ACE3MZ_04815 [Paenibacillus sp. WLX1005]|uniref:hypothetical protein n=1 Tax=unclassified Paenibacillus TaxID=185978 RepID=UPI0039844027
MKHYEKKAKTLTEFDNELNQQRAQDIYIEGEPKQVIPSVYNNPITMVDQLPIVTPSESETISIAELQMFTRQYGQRAQQYETQAQVLKKQSEQLRNESLSLLSRKDWLAEDCRRANMKVH